MCPPPHPRARRSNAPPPRSPPSDWPNTSLCTRWGGGCLERAGAVDRQREPRRGVDPHLPEREHVASEAVQRPARGLRVLVPLRISAEVAERPLRPPGRVCVHLHVTCTSRAWDACTGPPRDLHFQDAPVWGCFRAWGLPDDASGPPLRLQHKSNTNSKGEHRH